MSSLDIEVPKENILLVSSNNKDNYLVSLVLINKTLLATLISLMLRNKSLSLLLLVPNIPINLNLIKLKLVNVNNIFSITNIQESLNPNQIILQGKIQK